MKLPKLLIIIVLTFSVFSCESPEEGTSPDNSGGEGGQGSVAAWQDDYNFENTSILNIETPAPVGEEVVVGDGTPESITREAIQDALNLGGKITFNTGGQAVTVFIDRTLEVTRHGTCIDGANLITLDARKQRRIMYSRGAHSLTNPRFADDGVAELAWVVKGVTFQNGKTTGGPLAEDAPGANDNDGSGNGGQAGSGSAIWSGLSNQCFVVECNFLDNETKQVTGRGEETGGAVYARGKVPGGSESAMNIMDSYFANNKGTIGGAVNNLLTNLTIVRSGFFNNESSSYGAAVYTDGASSDGVGGVSNPDGFIKIHASVFEGNKGNGQGGAAFLFAYQSEIELTECLFQNNEVNPDFRGDALGGGLRTGNGRSKIRRCAFVNNSAEKQGGAFWLGENDKPGHSNLIENTTFVGNTAQEGNTENTGLGGAVMLGGGSSTLMNCTFYNNIAGQGGAIFGGADVRVQNTILFDNRSTNPWNQNHQIYIDVNVSDLGGNIQFTSFDSPEENNNLRLQDALNASPLLDETPDYKLGFTPVLKIANDSPAKGLGNTGNSAPSTDQINQSRSDRNDSGSYQVK